MNEVRRTSTVHSDLKLWVSPQSEAVKYLNTQVAFAPWEPDRIRRAKVTSLYDGSYVGLVKVGHKGDYYLSPVLSLVWEEKWEQLQALPNSSAEVVSACVAYSHWQIAWVGWSHRGRGYCRSGDVVSKGHILYRPATIEECREQVAGMYMGDVIDSIDDVVVRGDYIVVNVSPSAREIDSALSETYKHSLKEFFDDNDPAPRGRWVIGEDISAKTAAGMLANSLG